MRGLCRGGDDLGNGLCRIRAGESAHGFLHAAAGGGVQYGVVDKVVYFFRGEVRLPVHDGGSAGGEGAGVVALVVVRRKGVGDEEGGFADEGKLCEGGGAGAGDDAIRSGIGGCHIGTKAQYGDVFCAGGEFLHAGEVLLTGDDEVMDGGVRLGGIDKEAVEVACALGAAGDEDEGFILREVEACAGFLRGGKVAEFFAHGGAGKFASYAGEVGDCFLKANQHAGTPAGGGAVCFAGQGVGIMHIGAEAHIVPGFNGGQAGKATHAQYHICPLLADDGAAAAVCAEELPEEARHAQGEGGWLGNGGYGVELEVAVFAGGFGIHLFAGDEQHGVVPHAAELLCHGNAGEEVAACAAAGDDDVHGLR